MAVVVRAVTAMPVRPIMRATPPRCPAVHGDGGLYLRTRAMTERARRETRHPVRQGYRA